MRQARLALVADAVAALAAVLALSGVAAQPGGQQPGQQPGRVMNPGRRRWRRARGGPGRRPWPWTPAVLEHQAHPRGWRLALKLPPAVRLPPYPSGASGYHRIVVRVRPT